MTPGIRALFALFAGLTAGSALAVDRPEPSLSWRLSFGAGTVETGYGVALAYRAGSLADGRIQLASLDVSDRAALARFAGIPLFQRDYRLSQNEARPEFRVALSKPWYAKRWVWWTAGGLAATAALAGAGSGGGGSDESTVTDENTCVGPGINAEHVDADCAGIP